MVLTAAACETRKAHTKELAHHFAMYFQTMSRVVGYNLHSFAFCGAKLGVGGWGFWNAVLVANTTADEHATGTSTSSSAARDRIGVAFVHELFVLALQEAALYI